MQWGMDLHRRRVDINTYFVWMYSSIDIDKKHFHIIGHKKKLLKAERMNKLVEIFSQRLTACNFSYCYSCYLSYQKALAH